LIRAIAVAPGEGIAAVQTARGVLLHRVRFDSGRVADYQIVAPTEWNFHPEGAFVRGIAGMAARDAAEAERRTVLAAQTLDPCVALRIEVGHA
jgi:Ni,Fe-hydrogenase I large subunit